MKNPSGTGDRGDECQAVVGGNNAFAFDLFSRLGGGGAGSEQKGNLFISPFSISAALAMTWAGARGETETQMTKVLRFPLPRERQHAAFALLLDRVARAGGRPRCTISTANALWGQKGLGFQDEFLKKTRDCYGAGFNEVDFRRDVEAARLRINDWVKGETAGKIKELIARETLTPATCLVLTNAVHFKADWKFRFDAAKTVSAPFRISAGKEVTLPLMTQKGRFRYVHGEGMQAVEMPYAGGTLSMVVLLPDDPDGLDVLERSLSAVEFDRVLASMREREISLSLPRFALASNNDIAKTLAGMGMPAPFSGTADFSGITASEKLFISHILHQACIDVYEAGAEAAAATAVVMEKMSLPEPPPSFRADHPFLFAIRHVETGAILFLGRLVDPPRTR